MTEEFEGFDEYYPGSKQKRGERAPATTVENTGWDVRPRVYRMGGQNREFFLVGDLAKALGRSPVTVRKWERLGIIPRAPFRSPARGEGKALRLYTREMVEGIVAIAREEGLMESRVSKRGNPVPPPNIGDTKFTERCVELFRRLRP